MQMVNAALISIAICGAAMLTAQEPSSLAVAKAIDQEILKLRDLPDDVRAHAIKDLALRIRQQPQRYAVALAFNLVIDGTEAGGRDTLQEVATTLADALRKSPTQDIGDPAYRMLAELARYYHVEVSLDDPRYTAAISKLRADDQHRSEADFTLTDVQEQKWNLKSLRGKVVLVNFWATWCPPCRREIPDLDALYKRFRDQGLVILAITDEEASIVRPFISQQKVSYPVLLDPGQKVKELFRVDGIPKSFVYDREERLVGQAIDRPTMQGFLEMLAQAGLQ
jgi:peroxiredoxin